MFEGLSLNDPKFLRIYGFRTPLLEALKALDLTSRSKRPADVVHSVETVDNDYEMSVRVVGNLVHEASVEDLYNLPKLTVKRSTSKHPLKILTPVCTDTNIHYAVLHDHDWTPFVDYERILDLLPVSTVRTVSGIDGLLVFPVIKRVLRVETKLPLMPIVRSKKHYSTAAERIVSDTDGLGIVAVKRGVP